MFTSPEFGVLFALGAAFLFALIGAILINRSSKQEEKKRADRFQRFWGNN